MTSGEAKPVRLISRLDIKGTNLIKGIRFEGLRVIGSPNEKARQYYDQGIDELLYIDAVASLYNRSYLGELVTEVVKDVFVPITVGGGIRSVDDVRALHGHVVGHARRRLAVEVVAAGAERGTPDGEARAVGV
jgi:imidazole glycerol phosphate synthase subunit HisF